MAIYPPPPPSTTPTTTTPYINHPLHLEGAYLFSTGPLFPALYVTGEHKTLFFVPQHFLLAGMFHHVPRFGLGLTLTLT